MSSLPKYFKNYVKAIRRRSSLGFALQLTILISTTYKLNKKIGTNSC